MDYVQLNSGLTQADVAIATPQPSGVTLFSATDAAVSPEFFYTPDQERENAYLNWRILLQVVAMQMNTMQQSHESEYELWKTRILNTLQRISQQAQIFNPQSFPSNITPPTEAYRVLSASGVNWCDAMTNLLSVMFLNVQSVDTSKIEIQDAALLSSDNAASTYNLPALLGADNISILQEPTR